MALSACRVLGLVAVAGLNCGLGGCNRVERASEKAWENTVDFHNKVWNRERPPEAPLTGSEAIDRSAYDTLGYGLQWSGFASFEPAGKRSAGGRLANVELLGDLLVMVDNTTAATALSTGSGQTKWSAVIANSATKFNKLTRVGSHIMATDAAQAMLINAESGQLEGRQRFDRLASTAPIMLGDLLVMGSTEYLFAHMMRTGHDVWTYRVPAPVRVDPVYAGGAAVAFVSADGSVMIIDAGTGSMHGVGKTWGDAGAKPAAGDGAVFVASLDQSMYAFNTGDGGQRWRVRTEQPLNRPPAYYNGAVFVHVPGMGMVGLKSSDGSRLWRNPAIVGDVIGARKGNLIAWDKESATATVIDPGNGDIVARVKLENVGIIRTSGFADGDWYVVSPRGEVSKFSPKN